MDRIQMLEVFAAVAEAGSFAGGARVTGLSPPSVTRGVNELEERLGARLFTRTTRVVRLTDVGQAYLSEVRSVLADLAAADTLASGAAAQPTGLLRITAPVEFGRIHIAPILAAFLDTYRDISADLLTVDRMVNLVEEGLDIAVRIGPLPSSGLMALRVGEVRRVTCASPGYLSEYGTPATPNELRDHRIVSISGVSATAEWRFSNNKTIRLTPRLTVSSVAAGIDLARSSWGVTQALSYQVGPALEAGELHCILEEHEEAPLPVHLVHAEGRRVPAKVRCFLDFAKECLRKMQSLG